MPRRRTVLTAGAGGLLWLAGCSDREPNSTTAVGSPSAPAPATIPPGPYWYTHPRSTGNRILSGAADLRATDPVRIAVDGRPMWLVAHTARQGSYWTVVTTAGTATRWRVHNGAASAPTRLSDQAPTHPPVVAADDAGPVLLDRPSAMSQTAGQMVASEGGLSRRLFVAANGDLVVDGDNRSRLPIDAPPDVRPASLGDGRYVIYGDVTDRYGHGALGDRLEPSSLLVVDPTAPAVVARTRLDASCVFEGLQPLIADLDGDGDPEVVTTIADTANGARLAIYSPAVERIATGPVHGLGWRHQLVVAPFGPDGTVELAVVLQPHITRRLEYYRLGAGELTVQTTLEAVSSHTYGSRILGGAVAADLDGDGTVELLVPTANRRRLVGVSRTTGGAHPQWSWPLGDQLTSNLTGVGLAGGGVAVGAATASGVLVWSGSD